MKCVTLLQPGEVFRSRCRHEGSPPAVRVWLSWRKSPFQKVGSLESLKGLGRRCFGWTELTQSSSARRGGSGSGVNESNRIPRAPCVGGRSGKAAGKRATRTTATHLLTQRITSPRLAAFCTTHDLCGDTSNTTPYLSSCTHTHSHRAFGLPEVVSCLFAARLIDFSRSGVPGWAKAIPACRAKASTKRLERARSIPLRSDQAATSSTAFHSERESRAGGKSRRVSAPSSTAPGYASGVRRGAKEEGPQEQCDD